MFSELLPYMTLFFGAGLLIRTFIVESKIVEIHEKLDLVGYNNKKLAEMNRNLCTLNIALSQLIIDTKPKMEDGNDEQN